MAKSSVKVSFKITLVVLGLLSVLVFVVIIFFLAEYFTDTNFLFHNLPTDQQLIDRFQQHNSEFEQLAQMLSAEKDLQIIYPNEGNCQSTNQKVISMGSNSSCAHFVNMFRDLDLEWSYTAANGNHDLWLTISTSGLAVSGSSKGYYYSVDRLPENVMTSKNTDNASGQFIFRQIEKNWYIFVLH